MENSQNTSHLEKKTKSGRYIAQDTSQYTQKLGDYMVNPKPMSKGGFGTVHKAIDKKGNIYIIKAPKKGKELDIVNETRILKILKHLNIVDLKEILYTSTKQRKNIPLLVMEYLPQDLIENKENKVIHGTRVAKIAYDIADAIQFAHYKNYVHRDIKRGNIRFQENGNITAKLYDWGNALNLAVIKQLGKEIKGVGATTKFSPQYLGKRTATKQFKKDENTGVWTPNKELNPEEQIKSLIEMDWEGFGITLATLLTGEIQCSEHTQDNPFSTNLDSSLDIIVGTQDPVNREKLRQVDDIQFEDKGVFEQIIDYCLTGNLFKGMDPGTKIRTIIKLSEYGINLGLRELK